MNVRDAGHYGPAQPSIWFEGDGCVMASWRNIAMCIWTSPATEALVAELQRLVDHILDAYPNVCSVHVTIDVLHLPELAVRKKLRSLVERFESRTSATVVVIAGVGFWTSAIRGLLTSLRWIGRKPTLEPLHICRNLHDAASVIALRHNTSSAPLISARELEGVLRRLCERLNPASDQTLDRPA